MVLKAMKRSGSPTLQGGSLTSHDRRIKLSLAGRAVEGRPSRLHDPAHGAGAVRRPAGRPLAVVHPERVLKVAKLAVRLAVVAQRRATGVDCFGQHGAYHRGEGADPARADTPGLALWVDARPVKRLADINVTQARDDPLIEKRGFDGRAPSTQPACKVDLVEAVAQGLGSERPQQPVALDLRRRREVHRAETACIVEGHARTVAHAEDHVIMAGVRRMGPSETALQRARYENAARHAEVDDQRLARREIGEDV